MCQNIDPAGRRPITSRSRQSSSAVRGLPAVSTRSASTTWWRRVRVELIWRRSHGSLASHLSHRPNCSLAWH